MLEELNKLFLNKRVSVSWLNHEDGGVIAGGICNKITPLGTITDGFEIKLEGGVSFVFTVEKITDTGIEEFPGRANALKIETAS